MQTVNVADIQVKEGITKEGARAGQKWELIIITGDDGSEYTTFDSKAKEVGIGGVIELEPIIKNGKINFTKFTIKKKGQAPAPTSNGKPEMTNEMWEAKDRIKNKSIEDQTRAKIIADLLINDCSTPELTIKLQDWLGDLGDSPEPSSKPVESPRTATKDEGSGIGAVNNLPDFHKLIHYEFGLQPGDSLKILGLKTWTDVTDSFEACYNTIKDAVEKE